MLKKPFVDLDFSCASSFRLLPVARSARPRCGTWAGVVEPTSGSAPLLRGCSCEREERAEAPLEPAPLVVRLFYEKRRVLFVVELVLK